MITPFEFLAGAIAPAFLIPSEHLLSICGIFLFQFGIMMRLEFEAKCTAFFLIFVTLFEYGLFRGGNYLMEILSKFF